MPEGSVAAGFARALADLAVSEGASRDALLEQSGIAAKDLEDQDNRVAFPKYVALMRAAKALCNDPALALHFGEAYDMTELSIVGLLGQAATSGADAFAQLGRYTRLIADIDVEGPKGSDRLAFLQEDGQLWLVDRRSNPNDFPELTESSFARMVATGRRFGSPHAIKEAHVTHPAPPYRTEYERIFGVPIVFESARNALRVDQNALAFKPLQPSRYVFGLLSDRADALLKDLEGARSLRARVESLLLPILHTGDTGMVAVAAKLGMSRPTLSRRLKLEGVTFEKVLDELRHRMAIGYLKGKKVSVNETAYLVGFSEPAAFSRAFKRWTGMSPREMRNR